jgi:hypothetical protein
MITILFLGRDLAKNVFPLHSVDTSGRPDLPRWCSACLPCGRVLFSMTPDRRLFPASHLESADSIVLERIEDVIFSPLELGCSLLEQFQQARFGLDFNGFSGGRVNQAT